MAEDKKYEGEISQSTQSMEESAAAAKDQRDSTEQENANQPSLSRDVPEGQIDQSEESRSRSQEAADEQASDDDSE